jgi:hypothetical protein
MRRIANFRVFWHPGANTFCIEIQVQGGQAVRLPINSPEGFIAVL